jgi:hypothetical protein
MLALTPERVIIHDGFDLAFASDYAPRHRPGGVAISVAPSVVYHTGLNGLHVRDRDLNCEYPGDVGSVTVQCPRVPLATHAALASALDELRDV